MERDINLVIEDFRQNLIKQCNEAGLPASVVYYVFKDVFNLVEDQYRDYLEEASAKEQERLRAQQETSNMDE